MQRSKIKKIIWNSFWLSVLFHLLILFYLFYILKNQPIIEKKILTPHEYVPAYTYSGSIKPSMQQQVFQKTKNTKTAKHQQKTQEINPTEMIQKTENIPSMIHVPKVLKKTISTKTKLSQASLLADSFNMLREEQMQTISKPEESEPIYLVGDDSQPADPLIKLIGQSLSKHFKYPSMAGQLGIKGRVLVKLTLHPEGYYSDVVMIQSSNNQELDSAALYAVNAAPNVYGADRFISKPKRMTIGFIFE